MKDEQDRLLESMFETAPLADNGFSNNILRRIRRKLWIRRVTLPAAVFLGGLIAYQPMAALLKGIYPLLQTIPGELVPSLSDSLPSLQLIVTGALVLVVALYSLSMIED